MLKPYLLLLLLALGWHPLPGCAQHPQAPAEPAHTAPDLAHLLPAIATLPDSARLDQLREFADVLIDAGRFDEANATLTEAAEQARATGNTSLIASVEHAQGYLAAQLADFAVALQHYQRALDLARPAHNYRFQIRVLTHIAGLSHQTKNWAQANQAQQQALALAQAHHLARQEAQAYGELSNLAGMQKHPALALAYNKKALAMHLAAHDTADYYVSLMNQALVYKNLGQYAESARSFRAVEAYARRMKDDYLLLYVQVNFPRTLLLLHQPDEAERYARQALAGAEKTHNLELLHEAYDVLTAIKEQQGNYQSALAYQHQATCLQDSIFNQQKSQQLITTEARYQTKARQARIAQLAADNAQQRHQVWALLAGVGLIGTLAFGLARSSRRRLRANALLEQQKAELQAQRDQTAQALAELKAAQAQLIQREKMASLGELTAGIAHEIQNPLNFVNNFAEVSTELVAELREEHAQPTPNRAAEAELLEDLTQNLQKITQHGQRAAGIVRGMLEHSRASTSERQPTDLNALANEYLHLAYHGLRAKDKTFTAELKTDFAAGLPPAKVVGPDVGRVLLNLFNNAFYAVQQRQKRGEAGYQPTVSVSTQQLGQRVLLKVSDNGTGMPTAAKEKIFQPFFTTKPTGEGTGLGLSLSYDIITKGHGGTLTVESQEGVGTELIITLPI